MGGKEIHLPALTQRDRDNLAVAADYGVSGVMQPFVRDRADLETLRAALDAAMFPLDPRLEDSFGLGAAYLCAQLPVRLLLPMHMWGKYEWIGRFCREHPEYAGSVAQIRAEGDSFTL